MAAVRLLFHCLFGAYAKNYVKVAAKARGVVFNDKVIETTIEAKVYDLKRLLELPAG